MSRRSTSGFAPRAGTEFTWSRQVRSRSPFWRYAGYLGLGLGITFLAQKVIVLFGPATLIPLVGAGILALLYGIISFRNLIVPFLVLIASVGCLRFVWSVRAPFLPDIFMDRVSLIWLTIVFASLAIYRRIPLRRPFTLDLLLIMHATYLAVRVLATDPVAFHTWTMSILTPYATFFFAKNIIRTRRQIRYVLVVLASLSVYYTVTSISEKFHITALLYPKIMALPHPILAGRSSGPFRAPGIFGDSMAMVLPVFLYFIQQTRNKFVKIVLAVQLLAGLVAIYFTYTRGCMLAVVLSLGVVVFMNRKAYLKYLVPVVVVAPVLFISVIGVKQDRFLHSRLEATNPIESRIGAMVTAVRLWRAFPLFGVGPYQFGKYVEEYAAPVEVPIIGTVHIEQFRDSPAHDLYLSPLAEDGAVGGLMQLLIYIMVIRTAFDKLRLRKRGDHFATYILPLFFAIWAVYHFGGFIIPFRYFSFLGSMYYMVAGITYGYNPDEAEDPSAVPAST